MANLKNIKLVVVFIVIFFIFGLISCTKKSDEVSEDTNNQADLVEVSEDDFIEKDEDLLTVDYKEFYDELAPHGEWIEVTDKEVGLELKKGSSSNEGEQRKITLSELFGVKEAYADDVSFGAFFVWKPAPNLAVGVNVVEPEPVYVPYTNGQWVYTDAGWYFRAPTPHEEIVHHHGRWVHSPTMGWVWMPGRVWAPAWVDWRETDTYVSWAPIPPSIYIVNNVVIMPPIIEDRYIVVERRYFIEPDIYKYHYKEHKNKIMIKEWRRIDGVMVMNKTVINKGPDITVVRNVIGRDFDVVKVHKTKNKKSVSYSGGNWDVYSPVFKMKKDKKNIRTFSKPDKFITYNHVKNNNSKNESGENRNDGSVNKNKGSDNKGNEYQKNKDKGIEKRKKGDDSNMKDGGKNKGNEKKSYDNKSKGNDNKSKGNDKGNQNKGNKNKGNK